MYLATSAPSLANSPEVAGLDLLRLLLDLVPEVLALTSFATVSLVEVANALANSSSC